ncbi:uncharacterized protein LOC142351939 [Convolutriloba macropyga]|uniref:uncharacterized protein LOC142351939 n=1 Tax=Convolutriloba macropyga TaxID=536237 RepID=UPI003F51D841
MKVYKALFIAISVLTVTANSLNVLESLKKNEPNRTSEVASNSFQKLAQNLTKCSNDISVLQGELHEQNETFLAVVKQLQEENEELKVDLSKQADDLKAFKEKCDLLEIKWNVLKEFRGNL